MKVLQTLGHSGGKEFPREFFYKRAAKGVYIYENKNEAPKIISHQNWAQLISVIAREERQTFPLSSTDPDEVTIHTIIGKFLGNKYYNITPTTEACIAAILEHEGTIDHYRAIILRKDID